MSFQTYVSFKNNRNLLKRNAHKKRVDYSQTTFSKSLDLPSGTELGKKAFDKRIRKEQSDEQRKTIISYVVTALITLTLISMTLYFCGFSF